MEGKLGAKVGQINFLTAVKKSWKRKGDGCDVQPSRDLTVDRWLH
jgi:hypothetical protein